jgi:hypothetical protein
MLRTALFAAILVTLSPLPGAQRDGTGAESARGTEAPSRSFRPTRPRRTPPAPTLCRETLTPEPAPSCGP